MTIEVLIPTHHKSIDEIKTIVDSSNSKTSVLVCNQVEEESNIVLENKIHIVSINNIGVSNNRNNLLNNASGDICVCIDDDCCLVDKYIEIVSNFFDEHPDAEFVLFNGIVKKENGRLIHKKKTKKVRCFNDISYGGGPGLVFKKEVIKKYNLRYNTSVGYPNYIYMGEDTLFLYDLVKSKAIVYRSSDVLFSIEDDVTNSIYFEGVTEHFLICKGYITSIVHPYLKRLYLYRYAYKLRHWRNNKRSLLNMVGFMKIGFTIDDTTTQILSKDECKTIMLDILKEFHTFCFQNKLRYSIWYGTAIGAIRHGGFIPWDDDIDVVMPREDYNKFIKLYTNNDRFVLHTDNERKYRLPYAKMCDATTSSISMISLDQVGVFIDIFPLDLIDLKDNRTKRICNQLEVMRSANLKKGPFVFPNYRKNGKKLIWLRKIKYHLNYMMIPIKRLFCFYNCRKKIINNYISCMQKKEYGVIGCYPSTKEKMDKRVFDNIQDISFESVTVKIFKDYDKYLKILYGDYMSLPKVEDRQTHSYYLFFRKF